MSQRMPVYAIQSGNQYDGFSYRHITAMRPPSQSTFVGEFVKLTDNETGCTEWSYWPKPSAWPQPSLRRLMAIQPR